MRTTIEIRDDLRAELMKLAAERGLKGFSTLVEEAVEQYLRGQSDRRSAIEAAMALKGSLSEEAADELKQRAQEARASWR